MILEGLKMMSRNQLLLFSDPLWIVIILEGEIRIVETNFKKIVGCMRNGVIILSSLLEKWWNEPITWLRSINFDAQRSRCIECPHHLWFEANVKTSIWTAFLSRTHILYQIKNGLMYFVPDSICLILVDEENYAISTDVKQIFSKKLFNFHNLRSYITIFIFNKVWLRL